MENNKHKIILLHWEGRFGNRMFQYAFGNAYAKKYNCTFYIPSNWEGDELFIPSKYCKIVTNEILKQGLQNRVLNNYDYYIKELLSYNTRTNDDVQIVNFVNNDIFGKQNIAFYDVNCMYFKHCYDIVTKDTLKYIFRFNNEVLNSDVYQFFYKKRGNYNAVHLRRGDVATPDFNGSYSVITKKSYMKKIKQLNLKYNMC